MWRLHAAPPPTRPTPIFCRTLSRSAPPPTGTSEHPAHGPLPRDLVERAANVFVDLRAGAPRVLLHGDLHHDNVLRSDREGWLAIDPSGVHGDPGFEAGAMLYNPDPERHDDALLGLVPARVEQLADGLGQPLDRIVAWGFVMAALSEVWTTEGDGHRAAVRLTWPGCRRPVGIAPARDGCLDKSRLPEHPEPLRTVPCGSRRLTYQRASKLDICT